MTPEIIKTLTPSKVARGQWIALVHEESKRVVFLVEYPNGGEIRSNLRIVSKSSKEELLALIKDEGLTYEEPKTNA
jgi:hypothetical protein